MRDVTNRKISEAGARVETERREATAVELARSQERLAEAQAIGGVGSWDYDLRTDVFVCSGQIRRIYGLGPAVALGLEEVWSMTFPDDQEPFRQAIFDAVGSCSGFEVDHRIVVSDGTERVVHTRGEVDSDEAGRAVVVRGTAQDVTDARRAETALRDANDDLRRLATTDVLTGLPNRACFDDRLGQALALGRREGRQVAVLFVDLDRFKEVNDSLGRHFGDDLLVDVAARLGRVVRESDTAARGAVAPSDPGGLR